MTEAKKSYDCAVIGSWHLAFVTASVLSSVGYRVVLVNPLFATERWNEFPPIPVHEPGLAEMMTQCRGEKRLEFANGINGNWKADRVWMAVDTPVDSEDRADVGPLLKIVAGLKKYQGQIQQLIVSSQIPLGFCQQVEKELGRPVVYIPENLRLGKGIETFLRADRTVIGATLESTADQVVKFMSGFQTQFLKCNLPTSEMIKHANNAFLAMSISFANELARLGECFEVDGNIVGQALKLDKRIGSMAYVSPGLGFAGGTLPRDLRTLQALGQKTQTPMRIIDSVLHVNADTAKAIADIVLHELQKRKSKRALILGYSYKADTNTLRRSPSLDLANLLRERGVEIHGFDPFMNDQPLDELQGLIQHHKDLRDLKTPDMIILMTARPDFKKIDWRALAQAGHSPLLLDTQNFLDKKDVISGGLRLKRLWSPTEKSL